MTCSTFLFVDFRCLRQNLRTSISEVVIMRSILLLTLLLLAGGASADSLTKQLRDCAAIEANGERLACYDALSNTLDQRAEQNFGREEQHIAEEVPESIDASISEIRPTAYGKQLITLDNGQVWRQNDSSPIHWESGDKVVIERGIFSSFFMKETESGRRIRVKRVK